MVQLAMKGRILTPVTPHDTHQGAWTLFTDIWAGGCAKEPWDSIFIQAPTPIACRVFEHVFEHNPRNSTCTCCGEDYFIGAAEEFVYNNALFIKEADILPEWTKPLNDVYTVKSPDFVTITWEDITKGKFVDPTVQSLGLLKDLDVELDKNSVITAAGLQLKHTHDFKLKFLPPEKVTLLDANDVEMPWPPSVVSKLSDDLPIVVLQPKEDLPPGMHYAYDKLPKSKKKKK